jgi:hypothetical protein
VIFPLVWRLLPGPLVVRLVLLTVLVLGLVCLCFGVVFPWVAAELLPPPDAAVG